MELVRAGDPGTCLRSSRSKDRWRSRSTCSSSSVAAGDPGRDPSDIEALLALPKTCDVNAWVYEHVRQLVIELSLLVTFLKPHCTVKTCPVMNVHPDSFLCVVHPDHREVAAAEQCYAYDYMVHNLNHGTASLQNPLIFPSRFSIPESSVKQLQAILKRLCRIVAHSYIYHKEAFLEFEVRCR